MKKHKNQQKKLDKKLPDDQRKEIAGFVKSLTEIISHGNTVVNEDLNTQIQPQQSKLLQAKEYKNQQKFDQKFYNNQQKELNEKSPSSLKDKLTNLLTTFVKEEKTFQQFTEVDGWRPRSRSQRSKLLQAKKYHSKKSKKEKKRRRRRWVPSPRLSKKEKKEKRLKKFLDRNIKKYYKRMSYQRYFTMIRGIALKHFYLRQKTKKLERFYNRKNILPILRLNKEQFDFFEKKRKKLVSLFLFNIKPPKVKKLFLGEYKKLRRAFLILIIFFSKNIKKPQIKNNFIFAIQKRLFWLRILCQFYFIFLKKGFYKYKIFLEKIILFYSLFLNKEISLLGKYLYLNEFILTLLKPFKKLNLSQDKFYLKKEERLERKLKIFSLKMRKKNYIVRKKLKKKYLKKIRKLYKKLKKKKEKKLKKFKVKTFRKKKILKRSFRRKAKFKKIGYLYYRGKRRNLNLTFTNDRGKVLAYYSAGNRKFRKSKRRVSDARYEATMKMAQRIKSYHYKKIVLVIKKWDPHYHLRKILRRNRIIVIAHHFHQRKPHNGCRKRKPKRK